MMKFVVVFLTPQKENLPAQGYKYSYKVSPLCSKYSCCCCCSMLAEMDGGNWDESESDDDEMHVCRVCISGR